MEYINVSCPQSYRSHALFSGLWRQQILLTQEFQWEMHQQPFDILQLLPGLLGVCVAEAFLAGVFSQLSHVVHRVDWKTFEHLPMRTKANKRNEITHSYCWVMIYNAPGLGTVSHTLSYIVVFSLADAFQTRKKKVSLIGSSILMLGSEEAPTRNLERKEASRVFTQKTQRLHSLWSISVSFKVAIYDDLVGRKRPRYT